MTGLECLRDELRKRGYTKAQTESKVVLAVLDILTGSGEQYFQQDSLLRENNELKAEIQRLRSEKAWQENDIKNRTIILEDGFKEVCKYIDDFNRSLEECETAEGRDKIRTAQMYRNSIDINTVYDNTEYIKGLGMILSGNKAPATIPEIKKIDKKRFKNKDDGWKKVI